jgi:hypothetical protein
MNEDKFKNWIYKEKTKEEPQFYCSNETEGQWMMMKISTVYDKIHNNLKIAKY